MKKYEFIQEKPIKEHLNGIQKILKIIKDDIFHTEKSEESLNKNFKNQVLQIITELKSYNLKNRHNISLILRKIFRCSLILKTTSKKILNSQIKAKIFTSENNSTLEKLSHSAA